MLIRQESYSLRSFNLIMLLCQYHSSPSSPLRRIMYCGISLRSVLIHEGRLREIISSDPFSLLLLSRSCRYYISLPSFSLTAFSILASRMDFSASLFLDLGRLSRGLGSGGLRS